MPATELTFERVKRKRRMPKGKSLTKKQKLEVQSLINKKVNQVVELKHHDLRADRQEIGCFGFQATTQFYKLTSITQGVGDIQRIGDEVSLKSVFVRMFTQFNSSPQDRNPIIRVIIFQWNEDDASALPVASDILQDVGILGIPGQIVRQYTIDKDRKYTVLFDKLFNHSLTGGQDVITSEVFIDKKFNRKIQYGNGVTSGINQLYMMVQTSDNLGVAASNELPLITFSARVRYYDA